MPAVHASRRDSGGAGRRCRRTGLPHARRVATGSVAADMLVDTGATLVIVGHSERHEAAVKATPMSARGEAALAGGSVIWRRRAARGAQIGWRDRL